jgi:hypothetical protein
MTRRKKKQSTPPRQFNRLGDPIGSTPVEGDAPIEVSSMFGMVAQQGLVAVKWGTNQGILTPVEARQHAMVILEAADAAISDHALITWSRDVGDLPLELAAGILMHFRKFRAIWEDIEENDRQALRRTAVGVLADVEQQQAEEFVEHFLREHVKAPEHAVRGFLYDFKRIRRQIDQREETEPTNPDDN